MKKYIEIDVMELSPEDILKEYKNLEYGEFESYLKVKVIPEELLDHYKELINWNLVLKYQKISDALFTRCKHDIIRSYVEFYCGFGAYNRIYNSDYSDLGIYNYNLDEELASRKITYSELESYISTHNSNQWHNIYDVFIECKEISENFLRYFHDKIDWGLFIKYHEKELTNDFIIEFLDEYRKGVRNIFN